MAGCRSKDQAIVASRRRNAPAPGAVQQDGIDSVLSVADQPKRH